MLKYSDDAEYACCRCKQENRKRRIPIGRIDQVDRPLLLCGIRKAGALPAVLRENLFRAQKFSD